MAISPLAVKEYLNRPNDDHTYLKSVPRRDLEAALLALDPRPNIDDLMTQQLVGMLLGIAYPAFAFFYGMGTGKTLLALRLLEYWARCGKLRKAAIIVPSAEAVYSWSDEIHLWKCPLPYVELDNNASYDKAMKLLDLEHGLAIISYPGLRAMVTTNEAEEKKGELTGKNRMKPRRKALEVLCQGLGAVVWDEMTESKNPDSLNFRVCRAISKRVAIRYGLAGRPFGKDPFDLWAQQYLIDQGASLGVTQGLFRAAFYGSAKKFPKANKRSRLRFAVDYTFHKTMAPKVAEMSGHRSLTYSTEECVELPPISWLRDRIHFPIETLIYYDKIVEHLIAAKGDPAVRQGDFLRLRQLSSGFLGVKNDEYGAKAQIVFDKNPKLDQLMARLNQVPYGRKSVVFFEFIFSGHRISAALKKAHIKHSLVMGETKDRREAMRRFKEDPDCEVLVINHQIGAYSLNLQMANYVFIYENATSCIDRDQMPRRCWRKGQTRRVFFYDLVMIGSADEKILDVQKEGGDIYFAVMRNPALLRRAAARNPLKSRFITA